MVTFSSLNPYESLEFISGDSPEELLKALKAVRTPIKLVAIVPYGTKHVAYVMGDVRKNEIKKFKERKIANG
jgi:hypothetical protein